MKDVKPSTRIINRNGILQQCMRLSIKKTTPTLPPVTLPFPPQIDTAAFVTKLLSKKLVRFPNAFIMYRSEYVRHLKKNNYHLAMTDLSSMISYSWEKEPEHVKKAYKDISLEAEKLYAQKNCFQVNDMTTVITTTKTTKARRRKKPAFIATPSMDVRKSTTNNSTVLKNPTSAPHAQPTALQISESVLPLSQPFVHANYFEPTNSIYSPTFDMLENRMGTAFDNKINGYRCSYCTWNQQQSGRFNASYL